MGQCRRQSYHLINEGKKLFYFKEVELEIDDDAERITHLTTHKETVLLYISLTTCFCGCLASSIFIRDVCMALSNDLAVPFGPCPGVSLFSTGPTGASAPNSGFDFTAILDDSRYGLSSAACVDELVSPVGGQLCWLSGSRRHHRRILRLPHN